jgi:hypothetical protein
LKPDLRPALRPAKWISPDEFVVDGLKFRTVTRDFKENFSSLTEVVVLKPPGMITWYENYLSTRSVDYVLNLGIFQGGSELFLLATCPAVKLLAIDLSAPVEIVRQVAETQGWADRLITQFDTSQDDAIRLSQLIEGFIGADRLSMVIDDASHLYEPTKRAFEIAFPYLAPGSDYIIEDWGWANWEGDWQEPSGQWADQPALTNLIFELTMLAASRPDIIARIELARPDIAIITRGDGWPHAKPLSLNALYLDRGRKLHLL